MTKLPRKLTKPKKRDSRWRSQAHCTFVRGHACCVPGCVGMPIEVAHIRIGSGAGMGQKPHDWATISLCRHHHSQQHSQQHSLGERSFAEMYKISLLELAQAFADAGPKRWEIMQHKLEKDAA